MNLRSANFNRLIGSLAVSCIHRSADLSLRSTGSGRKALLSFLTLILLVPPAFAQLTDVTCGGEGDRPCGPSDTAYWVANTRSSTGTLCDYGLIPMPNPQDDWQLTCSNTTRRRLANILDTNDPRGFILREQEQGIGADVPLNLVNTLGTHNSYSNYTEGYNEDYHLLHFDISSLSFTTVDDPFAADQYYSISDQLDAGARTIRLDPYFYSGEMRVCHGPIYCNNTSDGRLFVYAIREVADWLKAHPGEFVIIGLQDNKVTAAQQYLEEDPINKYLLPYLYKSTDGLASYESDSGDDVWPTLRQLRAHGKQAMIFSSLSTIPSYAWNNGKYWRNDTSAKNLIPGQNLSLDEACKDDNGNDSRRRFILDWNNVGEDRSGSTVTAEKTDSFPFFEAVNSFGLMDSAHTTMATRCGASVIDLDFWGAMDHAFHFDVDVLGDNVTLVDFRGPANDPRPLNASWSYMSNDSFVGPAVLDEAAQMWVSEPAVVSFRYACASKQETPDVYEGLYQWAITDASGPWSGGEAACQQLGSQYHFWFPQSIYEQSNLLRYDLIHRASLSGAVWLNYRSSTYGRQLVTAPQQISISVAAGETPALQTILFSGGKGGQIKIISNGPFMVAQKTANGWPINELTLTPKQGAFYQVGSITQTIELQELDPNTGVAQFTTKIPVHIKVTDALSTSSSQIDLTPGSEQLIEVRAVGGAQDRIPFSVLTDASWLVVEQLENQTPAQVKVTAKNLGPGTYLGSFSLNPYGTGAGAAGATVTVQYVVK